MKKNFAAYYRPTEAEIKEAAKTAIFVFDTNALLDFYRINPEIADKALAVIDRNKDRVYITRHSDEEYHRHHYEVPVQMANMIGTVRKRLNFDKLRSVLDEQFKSDGGCCYPSDLFKSYIDKLQKTYNEIESAVSTLQSRYNRMLENHELQNRISAVFEDHVLPGLTDAEIDKIIATTGPERYGAKIPPGYMDAGKATDTDDNNTYGDLFIWMEILDYVHKNPNNVFFVGRDNKEEWVAMVGKTKIGPRRELILEFREIAPDNIFHICSLTDFLKFNDADSSLTSEELRAIRRKTETDEYNSILEALSGPLSDTLDVDTFYRILNRNYKKNDLPDEILEDFWSSRQSLKSKNTRWTLAEQRGSNDSSEETYATEDDQSE